MYAQAADTEPSSAKDMVDLKDAPSAFPMRTGYLGVPDGVGLALGIRVGEAEAVMMEIAVSLVDVAGTLEGVDVGLIDDSVGCGIKTVRGWVAVLSTAGLVSGVGGDDDEVVEGSKEGSGLKRHMRSEMPK